MIADTDAAGNPLLVAYALNMPNGGLVGDQLKMTVLENSMELEFYGGQADVDYVVERSLDLISWDAAEVTVSDLLEGEMRVASTATDALSKCFLRLSVRLK